MSKKRLILVGAKSDRDGTVQYGGVLTLCNGVRDYADRHGFDTEVINTLRSGFVRVSFARRITAGIRRSWELVTLLRGDKPCGVVLFAGGGWSFYERTCLALIARLHRVPTVVFIVGGWLLDIRSYSFLQRQWYGAWLKVPDTLAASGSNWVKLFTGLGVSGDRLVTIHYFLSGSGAVSTTPKSAPPGEPINFIFVGWMIKEKGVGEIVSALHALLKDHRVRFTFVGGGTMLDSVRETIRTSNWDNQVEALGWVSPERLQSELSKAHVFVLPSYTEGFPLSLVEAMSLGLPAICTDVGGISDSVLSGVNGFLIPPGESPALRSAMESYVRDPASVARHSAAALEAARLNHDAEGNCQLLFERLAASQ